MSDAALRRLALHAGLAIDWQDYRGAPHEVTPETLRAVLAALELPCDSPAQVEESTQRLEAEEAARVAQPAPPGKSAFGLGDAAPGHHPWGLAVQLYALRSPGDGGLGHYSALAHAARTTAAEGASALAISPVHASFFADATRYSPYAPSHRGFLNAWHIDPAAPPGPAGDATDAAAESAELNDWPGALAHRRQQLRARFAALSAVVLDPEQRDPLAQDFHDFRARGGEALQDHARFEALHERELVAGRPDWRTWAAPLRDPRGREVETFAQQHRQDIDFHLFLQWLADRQLGAAQTAARDAGMSLGLIADLAVGTDPGGSEAWSHPDELLTGLGIGAPPDALNAHGQDWGLTTFSPRALGAECTPFRDLLRAALRHAGGLRIDHVLGLNRLWLIPRGARATQGVYLRYPLAQLLHVCAVESWNHRAIVVGEDLGTVPAGLRETLAQTGLLGLQVLWFAREHGLYLEPQRWRETALATTTTHDLPTVAGWWSGRDLDWRAKLGLFAAGRTEADERAERERARRALWAAFAHAGLAYGDLPADPSAVIDSAVRFIGRTQSPLAILPIEDIVGLIEQPNLPGTTEGHPNWRRRLPAPLEELVGQPAAAMRLESLRAERNKWGQTPIKWGS